MPKPDAEVVKQVVPAAELRFDGDDIPLGESRPLNIFGVSS
jgi:hypothetical protein